MTEPGRGEVEFQLQSFVIGTRGAVMTFQFEQYVAGSEPGVT